MNKKLFTQMWNERRSNLPLWLELLLISVALWFVVDAMYVRLRIYYQPRGMDISHTYKITLGRLSSDNPGFEPGRMNWETESEDIHTIVTRISQRPDVEAVATSHYSLPYKGMSNRSNFVRNEGDSIGRWLREDGISPSFAKVFRLQGLKGETPEEMEEMFDRTEYGFILNGEIYREEAVRNADLPGIYYHSDPHRKYPIFGEIQTFRRADYSDEWDAASLIISRKDFRINTFGEMSLRVKENQDVGFTERFWKDAYRNYRIGNVYIQNIESMSDIREEFHKYDESQNKIYYGVISFMLFNVFIALFGIFWFRTRQRRREIAIHMALGSNRWQVFYRLISEGFILLILATVPALLIDLVIVNAELVERYKNEFFTLSRFALTTGITFLLIHFTIACSIAYPAFKATLVPPAEALNESE